MKLKLKKIEYVPAGTYKCDLGESITLSFKTLGNDIVAGSVEFIKTEGKKKYQLMYVTPDLQDFRNERFAIQNFTLRKNHTFLQTLEDVQKIDVKNLFYQSNDCVIDYKGNFVPFRFYVVVSAGNFFTKSTEHIDIKDINLGQFVRVCEFKDEKFIELYLRPDERKNMRSIDHKKVTDSIRKF